MASLSADGVLAGGSVVAVVADALEGLVDAAAVVAVGSLLALRTVRTTPASVTPMRERQVFISEMLIKYKTIIRDDRKLDNFTEHKNNSLK